MGGAGAARARHMLGNYEILETVGRGGMGVVYRAYDHVLGRTVALKVLRDDLRVQTHLVSRFQREARAVAALDHPNIVQVFAVGSIENVPFISMEFIEGRPLNVILREAGHLEWERAFHIAGQIAQGLAAAHDKGIFHRDIKPANILIDASDRTYITDFGIAKVMNADTQLTVDGSRLGTPHYMSPERCEGREATHRSDLYALGVLLFQCLTGRLPFEAPTPAELIEKIIADLPPRVVDLRPELPDDVDRLIAWTLEKNPRHRPADGHILADSLQRVLAGMPLEEEGPNLASALAEFRENFSTPAPEPGGVAEKSARLPFKQRLKLAWRAAPFAFRLASVTIGAFLLAAGAVALLAPPAVIDPVSTIAQTPGQGLNRWQRAEDLAIVREEAAGVDVATLKLPGYTVDSVVAAQGSGTWSLLVRPANGGSDQVLRVVFNVEAATARITAAPENTGLAIAGIAPAWHGADGHLTLLQESPGAERDTQWLVLDRSNDDPLVVAGFDVGVRHVPKVLPFQLGALAAMPDGQGIVAALSDSSSYDKGWYLAYLPFENGVLRFGHAITGVGTPIRDIAVAPFGDSVVFIRESEEGFQSFRIGRSVKQGAGEAFAAGFPEMPLHAISEDGLVLFKEGAAGSSGITVVDLASGEVASRYPDAEDAAWLVGGGLALAGPDRRGDRQIWYVRRGSSETRQQLTFFAGGVELPIEPSAAGAWIAAPVVQGEFPALALARVPGAEASASRSPAPAFQEIDQ